MSNADACAATKQDGFGKVYPARTLMFRVCVGTAQSGGNKYEMTTAVEDMSPIVFSEQTGKWFTLPWSDIIDMARDAGIDDGANGE